MTLQNKRLTVIIASAGILLLIPFIAMQISNEVKWSPFDFLVAGILLVSTGVLCEFMLRKFKKGIYRIALCVLVFIVLMLVWAELAVGIFGSPLAGS